MAKRQDVTVGIVEVLPQLAQNLSHHWRMGSIKACATGIQEIRNVLNEAEKAIRDDLWKLAVDHQSSVGRDDSE